MSALSPAGANLSLFPGWQTYTPNLLGATDNAVATFSTQEGAFIVIGNMVTVNVKLVSTTMTKTTLTDPVLINLPMTAVTRTGATWQGLGRCENTTPIPNPTYTEIVSAASNMTMRANAAAGNASLPLTYAVASPGIGVLTNTITINGTITYEYNPA